MYTSNISDRREHVGCTSYGTSCLNYIPYPPIYQLFRYHAKRVCLGQMNHEVIELPPLIGILLAQLANGVRIALPSKHSRQAFFEVLGSQFSMKMHLFRQFYYVKTAISLLFFSFLPYNTHFYTLLDCGDRREPVQCCATLYLCDIIPGWGGV